MSIYDFTMSLYVDRISPPTKRKPVLLSFLNALLSPLQTTHDETFVTYRDDLLMRLQYNSQKILLENILNNQFNQANPTNALIFILQNQSKIYIYHKTENAAKTYIYKASEAPAVGLRKYIYRTTEPVYNDFTVNIPNNNNIDLQEISLKALINSLIFAGKKYSIVYYTP